jgi:FkbM family methyltransferase
MMAEGRPDHIWAPQTTKLLLALAPSTRVAVIGGAYFGDQALLLAQAMKNIGGSCYCFDLNSAQIDLLAFNAQKNGIDNIFSINRGLWHKDDVRLIVVGEDSHVTSREAVDETIGIGTMSIDRFALAHGIDEIQILELVIGGSELSALKGAESFLKQPPKSASRIIFEIHRSHVDWSEGLGQTDIVRYLERFGYVLFAIRDYQGNVDMRGRPVELVPVRTAYLEGPPHGFNLLAVKDVGILDTLDVRLVEHISPKLLFHRDPKLHQPVY